MPPVKRMSAPSSSPPLPRPTGRRFAIVAHAIRRLPSLRYSSCFTRMALTLPRYPRYANGLPPSQVVSYRRSPLARSVSTFSCRAGCPPARVLIYRTTEGGGGDFDLPVLLHVRRAVDQVLKCLRRVRVRGGIAHAFNGSTPGRPKPSLTCSLGFGGVMTHERSSRIHRAGSRTAHRSDRPETDAPDMPPSWLAGKRNGPSELSRIAASLSALRGLAKGEVAAATTRNALAVMALSRAP